MGELVLCGGKTVFCSWADNVSTAATVMMMKMMSSKHCTRKGKSTRKDVERFSLHLHNKVSVQNILHSSPTFVTAPSTENLPLSQTSFAMLVQNIIKPVPEENSCWPLILPDPSDEDVLCNMISS